jgi:uncharacterized protein (TIGR02996 family)
MFPEHAGSVEANWFSGEIVPDDVVDPDDESRVEVYKLNNRPLPFLWFALVIHRGQLLVEAAIDLATGVTQTRLTKHGEKLFPGPEMAYLQAIHANGEDPAPKLVYADWLEERGDSRCQLLRTEMARQKQEGRPRMWVRKDHRLNYRQDIPRGYVPPEEMLWYWRWAAYIPEMTAEDRELRQLTESLAASRKQHRRESPLRGP